MHVLSRKTLEEHGKRFPDAKPALDAWLREAKTAVWKRPLDIKERYRSASILGNGRVVFNIKGNKYRLIVRVDYKTSTVLVRFFGTHAEYDKINAQEV